MPPTGIEGWCSRRYLRLPCSGWPTNRRRLCRPPPGKPRGALYVELGLAPATAAALAGGDAAANAVSVRAVLDGARGAQRDIAVLNAAAGLVAARAARSFEEGVTQAQRSIDDGAAASALERLIATSAG